MTEAFVPPIEVSVATRTLLAAGFVIDDFQRQPTHVEYDCTRVDLFGVDVRYVVAMFGGNGPKEDQLNRLRKSASERGRVLAVIAESHGDGWLSWDEFLESLGGAVPTWRALGETYEEVLRVSSKNELPENLGGEAWRVFEEAVGDGLEFVFGRRVLRLGSRRRGEKVPDHITQTPDGEVLLIDSKASKHTFDASLPELRPMKEYVDVQRKRQRGQFPLSAAVVVSREFAQDEAGLANIASDFLAETKVPVSFLSVDVLLEMISALKENPTLRTAINMSRVFTRGGFVSPKIFGEELRAAKEQRYTRGSPINR